MADEIRSFQASGHEAASREHLPSSPSAVGKRSPASGAVASADAAPALPPREIVLRLIEYFKA